MTVAVRGRLILTTDLERSLAAQLAVANRYGRDRDREIAQLARRPHTAPTAPAPTNPDDVDRLRQQIDRVCSKVMAYAGRPIARDAAAAQVEALIGELADRRAEIRRLQAECERARDGTAKDPDPVVYAIRESDFTEPLSFLTDQIRAAWRERHPQEATCATPSSSTTRSKSSSPTSTR